MSDNSLARLVEQCGHGKVGLECTLKRPTEAALMDSGIMLSKSSIELVLRDARCNLRSMTRTATCAGRVWEVQVLPAVPRC